MQTTEANKPDVIDVEVEAIEVAQPDRSGDQLPAVVNSHSLMAMVDKALTIGNPLIIEKMMDLQDRWEKKEARKAFFSALAKAKAKIPKIKKNRRVNFKSKDAGKPDTDYKHEDLAEITSTIDPILGEHGIGYRFETICEPGKPITVTCVLYGHGHEHPTSMTGQHDASGNKNPLQAEASAITYLSRYTLKAALGLAAAHDDDGNGGDDVPLTDEQLKVITTLIVETKSNVSKFCKVMGVECLPDIPAAKFEEAKRLLNEKKVKEATKSAPAQEGQPATEAGKQ